MEIEGLQKLTLLDFPGRVACTVFTPGCNFRCPFCQNASLVIDAPVKGAEDVEGFFSFLSKRKGILDGVAITGGEPLLQKDIDAFISRIREMGFQVKLDTNGSFPEILEDLIARGLVDYVAVDIKNSRRKYPITSGCSEQQLRKVEQTVELLKRGKVDYEFRTTVVSQFHEQADFTEIGEWIRGARRYFLQKFEDSGEIIQDGLSAVSKEEMELFAQTVRPFVGEVSLRGVY
ncbi:MAG: anaerobic ribonucleoside-triphosphate reductase activating protein [Oscillospiraceae bacterium]|nr:anaerobic ribonucleoside-triphosphate reductase activating protein [Oscillospiraceae bacterium]MBQ4000503.1 anaerobic ribonucleoside-triphosphate reductase activating protein [Oscillospiraceae bacterium]MBQ4241110.1 anaerobic ribonucleoside-triphosphate reductase activating protein [Oscillospiraceae bacterium]MBQ5411797.1 anaerobic ribonucleoside-triphosphate reductase activating protein [Oscillospiraceae bacterium]